MNLTIEEIISIVSLTIVFISIFVKMQVDNAIHKQNAINTKQEIDDLKKRLTDYEDKIENKVDEIFKTMQEIKIALAKITK